MRKKLLVKMIWRFVPILSLHLSCQSDATVYGVYDRRLQVFHQTNAPGGRIKDWLALGCGSDWAIILHDFTQEFFDMPYAD